MSTNHLHRPMRWRDRLGSFGVRPFTPTGIITTVKSEQQEEEDNRWPGEYMTRTPYRPQPHIVNPRDAERWDLYIEQDQQAGPLPVEREYRARVEYSQYKECDRCGSQEQLMVNQYCDACGRPFKEGSTNG